jgi:hypothetical protein
MSARILVVDDDPNIRLQRPSDTDEKAMSNNKEQQSYIACESRNTTNAFRHFRVTSRFPGLRVYVVAAVRRQVAGVIGRCARLWRS